MRLIVHTATPIRSKYGSELVKEANTLFLEEKNRNGVEINTSDTGASHFGDSHDKSLEFRPLKIKQRKLTL